MKRTPIVLSLVLGAYVFSYVVLSSFGAYAPAIWGTNGIKRFVWAPLGFYRPSNGAWVRAPMRFFYAPLSFIDARYWHTHEPFPEESDPRHPLPRPGTEPAPR